MLYKYEQDRLTFTMAIEGNSNSNLLTDVPYTTDWKE